MEDHISPITSPPQKLKVQPHTHQDRLNHNPSKLPPFKFTPKEFRNRIRISKFLSSPAVALSSEDAGNQGIISDRKPDQIQKANLATSPSSASIVLETSISPPARTKKSKTVARSSSTISATSVSRQGLSHSASKISHGRETTLEPLKALITRRSHTGKETAATKSNTTATCLDQHSAPLSSSTTEATHDLNADEPNKTTTAKPVTPLIHASRPSKAKRSFKMNGRIPSYRYDGGGREDDDAEDDRDRTLRALEGSENRAYCNSNNVNGYRGQDERRQPVPDSDDLFLNLARDTDRIITSRPEKRRSRIALPSHRNSMPIPPVSHRQTDGQNDEQASQAAQTSQPIPYNPRERSTTTTLGDLNKSRYIGGIPRSSPITPRRTTFNNREVSPDSTSPTATRRHPSIADTTRRRPSITDTTRTDSARRTSVVETSRRSSITEPPRKSSITEIAVSMPRNHYRQSNLYNNSPRAYNSSPLVSKTVEPCEEGEILRAGTEDTESTTSMTAQSTIWDELEDLKHRMKRVEVMGKMPPTSAATLSNSSNERPRTATTTVTTNSTSPKRGRVDSTASLLDTASIAMPHTEAHPNLKKALEKSKALLNVDVYDALEKTANDALTISAMMGTAGQPGPISSAHSAVGVSTSSVTDRQVRKKADNMCRGLTELCIALNERRAEELSWAESKTSIRPISQENDSQDLAHIDGSTAMRKVSDVGGQALARLKASPRTLERLSERRNSLFASSSQPATPRLPPVEATTPTHTANVDRRAPLMLRSRRAVTEDPDDVETRETRFRAPSRAITEVGPIGRSRNSPREYTSNRPLPEPREYASNRPLIEAREPPAQVARSSLPLRRHFVSNSLTSSLPAPPATPNALSRLESRRYLERVANRSTPERDSGNFPETQQLDDGHTQKKSSIVLAFEGRGIGRSSSMTRRTRINGTDS